MTGSDVSLEQLASRFGFGPAATNGTSVVLGNRHDTLTFFPKSRKLLHNGLVLYMNAPLTRHDATHTLALPDVRTVIAPLLNPSEAVAGSSAWLVVVDPGHGGRDPGTSQGPRVKEKKLVVDIARMVRRHLRGTGVAVKLTRSQDETIELEDRIRMANRCGADVFISIHLNSAGNPAAHGIETYVVPAAGFPSTAGNSPRESCPGNAHDTGNTVLAAFVHRGALTASGADDRGIRRARFGVLREAHCPAVLVECGFLSNPEERERLMDRRYRTRLAEGLAQGILTYISRANEPPR